MQPVETHPALIQAIDEQVQRLDAPLRAQLQALRELFALFTAERRRLSRFNYLDSPPHRFAYLRYHLPLNAARASWVLRELLQLDPALADVEEVVDLGAGLGSASAATMLSLPPSPTRRLLLTDRSRGALRMARELLERSAAAAGIPVPRLTCLEQKLPALPDMPPRALVWLSMVLNEIEPRGRKGIDLAHFFKRLGRKIGPASTLVIIEPALREPGLRLLEVHDALLAAGGWKVLAPCTHQKACPLLAAAKRPWCHFHFAWRAGRLVEEVADPLGLDHRRPSLSYLALRRAEEEEDAGSSPHLARVIGDPMAVRGGGKGVYICRDGRRETLRTPPPEARRGARIRVNRPAAGWKDAEPARRKGR
jgi:ribosomal protein RSM22 (predicted rRNA methylase)